MILLIVETVIVVCGHCGFNCHACGLWLLWWFMYGPGDRGSIPGRGKGFFL